MAKNTKPIIRFKGFTDAWEQRKLLDCIEKITDFRGRTPKKLGMDWSEEGYLALSALNVKDGYIDFTQDVHYGDQELYDKWMTGNELHEGQVLFTTEAPMGNVAQIPDNRRYILSQRTIAFDVKEDIITENFLATVLRTPEMFAKLTSLSSGGTAKGVSQKTLSVIDVMIPRENKEQIRLASLFSSLDHLITLHQRKYDSLVNVKKAMLEKMFPKNGETVPEIRFKGFTDAWEQRKLGEVAENFEYGLNAAAKEFDGVNKYIRITDIDDESHQFNKEDLTSPDTNLEIAERYKLEKGDILFARTGASVGKSYIYRESDGLVYYAGFLIRGKIKEGFDTEFVFQNTLTEEYKNYIRITSQRSGQPGVNAQEYQEYSFKVPHYAEQKQIGMLFKNLDNLITLHQRKLEKLKNIKKSCLEKMFV